MDLHDPALCALRMLRLSFPLICGGGFRRVGVSGGLRDRCCGAEVRGGGAADAREDERFRWYMGFELGPGCVYGQGGCYVS